jgi:type VI secretion system secreted protein Hcp
MSMKSVRWARLASAAVVGAVASGTVILLAGAVPLVPAQAAPVPAPQASCPAPVDPRAIARTSQAFAKIDGIQGDSTNAKHAGEVDVAAVRFALLGANSGLCGGSGVRASFSPLVLEKRVDLATVPLTRAATLGTHIPHTRVQLVSTGAVPVAFLTYDLTDVSVASVRDVDRGDSLTEEVELNFARIATTFVPVKADGTPGAAITFCWDIPTARAC